MVALDVMPVQASAVACERVFSSAKETDTLHRHCTYPVFFKHLQLMKYAIKKARYLETLTLSHLDEAVLSFLDDDDYHSDAETDDDSRDVDDSIHV
ncbi:unnamed protein product [Somion occarium]|uniref:HAT C-terminal dimerisation domain-containing protein n=1 Tax=Somion occarium TaxID=3059160 RepID=A0ABP1D7Z0_9APHY